MAAGDFYIRRNSGETDAVTTANFDSTWDATVIDVGSVVTYSAGTFTVTETRPYLVLYNERWDTADTTNNERIEIQGEILVNGSAVEAGKSQDFIRKSSGQQECAIAGYAILDLTANDTIDIRFYRTDNSTTGTVNRVPDWGGVQVLALDDADNFGLYSRSTTTALTTTLATVQFDTNDRQDTGFSNSSGSITITNAGRYLVCVGGDASITGTGRTEAVGELRLNGTAVNGSRNYCYLRGSDGCQDGALSSIHIIDVAASDVLTFAAEYAGSAVTLGSGFSIQIWQIPSGGTEVIAEETSGSVDMNSGGAINFGAATHIDTADFTYTAANVNIDVDQIGHYLVVATADKTTVGATQRAYPVWRPAVNGVEAQYGASGVYHRNSGGIGLVGLSTGAILPTVSTNSQVTINATALAAGTALAQERAQFAILNLASLYTYSFPPTITDAEDEQFDVGETGILLDGERFEAVQGTGTVELGDSPDYASATLVTQTVTSWSDTQIEITNVLGALAEGMLYLYVTNNTGDVSPAYMVSVGRLPYEDIIIAMSPDHYWPLNNNFDDMGLAVPSRPMTTDEVGPPDFVTTPLDRDNTHSLRFDSITERKGCADNIEMNTASHNQRIMGGWIQLGDVQLALSSVYKEGGGVNNMCFLKGLGNVIVAQVADTGEFTVQAYSDFRLAVDRPYHICMKWEANTTGLDNEIALFIDGVRQARSSGPPDDFAFDTHGGDINWGDPDSNLEMGGSDVAFAGPSNCLYSHWCTWSSGHTVPDSDIFDILFIDGAIPDDTIASGTEAAMQTAMDAFADTTRQDWPVSFQIPGNTGDTDYTLTLDNITFADEITVQVIYRGSATLSLRASNGTNLDAAKLEAVSGGTISIINTAPVSVTVTDIVTGAPLANARVRIVADTGGPLTVGTVVLEGLTDGAGQLSGEIDYTADQPVTGRVRKVSPYYKTAAVAGVVGSTGFNSSVLMVLDE